ncbi:hypothetical protein DRH14_02980 [Candidatus Shapirobacteria bacterium]|nr:MAG: hypothetical protein DRH14_02980 [Candidatus Shapirobacteria bacterium]
MMLYKGWLGGKLNVWSAFNKKTRAYVKDPYLLRGLPDLLFFKGENYPAMLAIECKVKGNAQTEHQRQFQKVFHNPKLKRFYILAYSWEDVEAVLRREMLD